MANCRVLESHQQPTDTPMGRLKRSAAQSLVRQMRAYWVVKNVLLQMLEGQRRAERPTGAQETGAGRAVVPEELEPVIDKRLGVRFEDPCKMPNMPRFRRLSGYERMQQCEL